MFGCVAGERRLSTGRQVVGRVLRASVGVLLAGVCLAAAPGGEVAKRVEQRLMAPCCWSESVAVHRSETAAGMRVEIARMAAGGSSEEQILETYVAQYGERIRMEPRGAKQWWLTVIPILLTLLALAGLLEFLRRLRRRPAVEPAISDPQSLPDVDLD